MVKYLNVEDLEPNKSTFTDYKENNIPNTEFTPDALFLQTVNNMVDEKLDMLYDYMEVLRDEIKSLKREENNKPHIYDMSREVSDKIAEDEIKVFLRKLKDEGETKFDTLDIIFELNLPSEQIERIIEKLRKRD